VISQEPYPDTSFSEIPGAWHFRVFFSEILPAGAVAALLLATFFLWVEINHRPHPALDIQETLKKGLLPVKI
jgi:hypothetical protein